MGEVFKPVSYTHLDVYKRQPMITPIIFYNLVTQICQAFQEFNGPYIITTGGPRGSTTLISLLVYHYAFKSYDMGMASALALSLIHI